MSNDVPGSTVPAADLPIGVQQAPRPPKPKRRMWLRWTVGAVVALGGLVAGAPYLLSTSWMNGVIRGWLRDNVERPVDFSSLEVTWADGITLRGLVVHDELEGQKPVLEAPLVVLHAPILPLLLRRFDVEEFVIVDPVVRIVDRGDTVNAAKVVRLRKRGHGRPGAPKEETAADEPLVLPDIRVPVTVRNLTLVLVDAQGNEARRPGIEFSGHLSTRAVPATFDLTAPTAGGGSLHVKGEATLFDADGVLLARDRMRVDSVIDVTHVDAQANADLLALFLPGRPAAGTLDAHVTTVYSGDAAKGTVDVRVRGVAVGDAVGTRAPAAGDDLTVRGDFEYGGGRIAVRGLSVVADGLSVTGDLAGTWPALDGKLELDADLARMSAALATFGVALDESPSGRARGTTTFTSSPAAAAGALVLDGFRVVSRSDAHPPVAVERAEIRFVGAGVGDDFRLDSFDLRLADVTAHASGTIGKGGALDLVTETKGDLGGLLARGRDLGLLPSGIAVRGTLDSAVDVKGRAGATGDDALAFTIRRLVLSEDDVRIEASGRATAAGDVDVLASGKGDLGKLLGRAQAAGASSGGADLSAVRGTFEFDASAKGSGKDLVVKLAKFRLDGDLAVDASGEYRSAPRGDDSGGALAASFRANGRIDDALALARGLGFLDREIVFGGTLDAEAEVSGTAKAPQVPTFKLKIEAPALSVDATGSIDASRNVRATAKGQADLAALADVAVRAGFVEKLPPVRGRLRFDADASGPFDRIEVPRASATLDGAPATVNVQGSLLGDGALSGTANAEGAIADLCRWAHEAGYLDKALAPAGKVRMTARIGGTRQDPAVPEFTLTTTDLLDLQAKGSFDATRLLDASASFRGPLQPLLDAAAQWTGEPATRLDGSFEGSAAVRGKLDALQARLLDTTVRAGGASVTAKGSAEMKGDARAEVSVSGPVADLLATLRAFGVAKDVEATGSLEASLDARTEGRTATGSVTLVAGDVVVTKPEVGGGTFREPHATLTVTNFTYDLDARKLAPVPVVVRMEGAEVRATVSAEEGPPAPDFKPTHVIAADGTLALEAAFARNHPELLSDVTFEHVEGPFRFAGDVSHGRDAAASWTGGADLKVTKLVAPHVVADTAHAVATIRDGAVVLDPIEGVVNGGPVTGTARIGLVGERPEHTFDLTGKDVGIQSDLAPLLARASPLFAVGEGGTAGGKAGVDVHLKARGMDSETVKRTLTGKGTMSLADAYVESKDWIGMLLSIVGSSGRLDISPVAVPFEVKDGKVTTGNVDMTGAGLLLRMGGEVGLDGKLDYALRLKPGSNSAAFEKYASFLDSEGWLPLRLEGKISKPKLRAPELKDVLKGKLDDLLGGLLGGKDEKDGKDAKKDGGDSSDGEKKKPKKKRQKKDDGTEEGTEEDPPPPPPPPPAKKEEDPPPPPPPPARNDDPPPPPPLK